MRILIIGSGGREHALAWKAAQSMAVSQVFVAPGNAGTAEESKVVNVSIDPLDFDGLVQFVQSEGIVLTIVGPEAPLVAGIRDHFDALGLACFGPSKKAAQLEGSKAFTKDFLARHNIPTADYQTFTDLSAAQDYIKEKGAPIVIKADGLAAGKGVIVARDESEALRAVQDMLGENAFGSAGHRVVIEEFLEGEEASFICLCDGQTALPFATSQDHKARDEGDRGPNTGGMGAYSPAPVVTDSVFQRIMTEVIEPTMAGMRVDGAPYQGFLYAGLMINGAGDPKVIEFNCRFGDPEAQPVMMRLRSDLVDLCQAALNQTLQEKNLEWDARVALGVVMAAGGYPGSYIKGSPIAGLEQLQGSDVKAFHAGTRFEGDKVVTSGGRVLCVVGLGADVAQAQATAYQGVELINWEHCFFRRDIGYRAIERR